MSNKGKKTQAEESAKVKKKLNLSFDENNNDDDILDDNDKVIGRGARSSTIGGGESSETDHHVIISHLGNFKSNEDLKTALKTTPSIPTLFIPPSPISPLNAGGYLSFGNTQVKTPTSSSLSPGSNSTPIDIKRGRSSSTSSGSDSTPVNSKSKSRSPLLFNSSEQPSSGGGFFTNLFSTSPKIPPTSPLSLNSKGTTQQPQSPNINLSLSPSLFSQDMNLISLQQGYMDEYYRDKEQKALDKENDELKTWTNVVIPNDQSLARKELKFIIRRGIPDVKRVKVWKTILGYHQSLASSMVNPNFFNDALSSAYGDTKVRKIRNIPSFGGVISPSDHFLTEEGTEALKQVLSLLALNFPLIDYCPIIPDIVHILLLFMSKETTYSMINILIENSNNPFYKYLNISSSNCTSFLLTFDTLIENHIPKLYKFMTSLGMTGSKSFSEEWFSRLFVASIPYPIVLRVFDIFLSEGYKVIYRVALAILMIHKKSLMKCTSSENFLSTLKYENNQLDSDLLIKKAFGIHLKRNQLNSIDAKQTVTFKEPEPSIPIYYKPKVSQPSDIIEDEDYEIIWAWLPHRLCICDPKIIFSSKTHGFNLRTLFEKSKNQSALLVLIKSDNKSVFGFFVGEELEPKDKYYGSSETFLFTLKPHVLVYKSVSLKHQGDESNCPPTNDLYINVGNDYIKVGSSEFGNAGIYLDSELKGNTNPTITFNNPNLNSDKTDFESVVLEVIAFV